MYSVVSVGYVVIGMPMSAPKKNVGVVLIFTSGPALGVGVWVFTIAPASLEHVYGAPHQLMILATA